MAYKRLRGNVLPIFTVKETGATDPAVSYADSLKAYDIADADKAGDDLTFAEAAAGDTSQYTFKAKVVVTFDDGALYAYMWDNAGKTVTIVFGPWGNAVPSATQPHFTFDAELPASPGLSMAAGTDAKGAEIERALRIIGKPVKVIA